MSPAVLRPSKTATGPARNREKGLPGAAIYSRPKRGCRKWRACQQKWAGAAKHTSLPTENHFGKSGVPKPPRLPAKKIIID